jgi:hypothetical protein
MSGIGRRGPIDWPPRSSDQSPMDFAVFGITKDRVYMHQIEHVQYLQQVINDEMRQHFYAVCVCAFTIRSIVSCGFSVGAQLEHIDD